MYDMLCIALILDNFLCTPLCIIYYIQMHSTADIIAAGMMGICMYV